jgi:hypothetical protein
MGAWSNRSCGLGGGAHETGRLPSRDGFRARFGRGATLAASWAGQAGPSGRGGKMRARKDGPDAMGSYFAGPVLTTPRIAPEFKMFTNSRVGVIGNVNQGKYPEPCECTDHRIHMISIFSIY